jgi:hypothetical protein
MDATQLPSRKLAIFLTLPLLLAAAPCAQAASLVAPSTISVSSLVGTGTGLSVTSSDGSTITFSVSVAYATGTPQWLSVNGFCSEITGLTTPATLTLAHGCGGSGASIQPATITLTPTSPAGNAITVTATLGSAQGTLTATGNPGGNGNLSLSAPVGGSATGTITLSTTSTSPIGFTITSPGVTWLQPITQTGGTANSVTAGNNAVLSVTASAAGLTSSPSPATININFNGTSTPILVSFNVGGTGTGGLSLSQNTVNWSFNTGGTALQQNISVNTSAPTYTATVTPVTPANVYWLQLASNINSGTTVNGTGNTTLTLNSNSNVLTLATGSYQATVQVTDSNLNNQFITVNLSVNGGTSGLSVSPNPVTISAAPGSTGSATVSIYRLREYLWPRAEHILRHLDRHRRLGDAERPGLLHGREWWHQHDR